MTHKNINYTNDPQKKYRREMVSKDILLEGLNPFHSANLTLSSDMNQDTWSLSYVAFYLGIHCHSLKFSVLKFLCYFCLVFVMLSCALFIDALWSPAGKGLTSWLLFVMSNCEDA